ncbi:MAG: ATP-binding cassette domain-containing protein [Acidimicrobiales bacterium]
MPDAADEVLPAVGALIDGPACHPWLTGRQNLERFDACGPDGRRRDRADRIEQALARVGLTNAADKRFKAYSLGMRQRLGLANALLRPRRLLILDEPTNGMDPQGTREIRHLVRELVAEGTTVPAGATRSRLEQLCTHVAVMNKGVAEQGALAELQAGTRTVVRLDTTPGDADIAVAVLAAAGLAARAEAGSVTAAPDGATAGAPPEAGAAAGGGRRGRATSASSARAWRTRSWRSPGGVSMLRNEPGHAVPAAPHPGHAGRPGGGAGADQRRRARHRWARWRRGTAVPSR